MGVHGGPLGVHGGCLPKRRSAASAGAQGPRAASTLAATTAYPAVDVPGVAIAAIICRAAIPPLPHARRRHAARCRRQREQQQRRCHRHRGPVRPHMG
jgi:hypothetical protein